MEGRSGGDVLPYSVRSQSAQPIPNNSGASRARGRMRAHSSPTRAALLAAAMMVVDWPCRLSCARVVSRAIQAREVCVLTSSAFWTNKDSVCRVVSCWSVCAKGARSSWIKVSGTGGRYVCGQGGSIRSRIWLGSRAPKGAESGMDLKKVRVAARQVDPLYSFRLGTFAIRGKRHLLHHLTPCANPPRHLPLPQCPRNVGIGRNTSQAACPARNALHPTPSAAPSWSSDNDPTQSSMPAPSLTPMA